jgi:hypothetical protein
MADGLLGQLAVDRGWINAAQLEDALAVQKDVRARDLYMRLGEILVRRAHLSAPQVRDLLEKQGITLVRCATCGKQFNARNWSRGKGACPCGGALDPAGPEAPLSVMGNAAMAAVGDGAPDKPVPPPGALRGQYFGRYPLLEEIGRGGIGLVYKAWDPSLARQIAIKVLIDAGSPEEASKRRHQFMQEARSAARLRHASIVSVHEVGQAGDRGYFTMDWIDGAPLSNLLKEDAKGPPLAFENGDVPARHAVEWMRDVALALQHAHQNGVVHCDVKPGNILIDRRNKALLSDFSASRAVRPHEADVNATRVLGTLSYMSPEQATGVASKVGVATDIWSVGAVLYEVLTGRRPFSGDDPMSLRKNIIARPLTTLRRLEPRVPKALEAVVTKCLAKAPAERYGAPKELADDLGRWLAGEPVRAPLAGEAEPAHPIWTDRRVIVAAALGAAIVLGGLGISWGMKRMKERSLERVSGDGR